VANRPASRMSIRRSAGRFMGVLQAPLRRFVFSWPSCLPLGKLLGVLSLRWAVCLLAPRRRPNYAMRLSPSDSPEEVCQALASKGVRVSLPQGAHAA